MDKEAEDQGNEKVEKGSMTVSEMASLGGRARAAKLTRDERFDQSSLGGYAKAAKYDRSHYEAMGKKGGGETVKRYGPEFFRAGMRQKGAPTRFQKRAREIMEAELKAREAAREEGDGKERS